MNNQSRIHFSFYCFDITDFNINYIGCTRDAVFSLLVAITRIWIAFKSVGNFFFDIYQRLRQIKTREHRAYLGRLKNLYFYICNFVHARVTRLPLHFCYSNNKHSNNYVTTVILL